MGHKRDKVHSFLTSAQKHRSAINQLRKKAAVQGKTEREARRKADAEGEKALLDAERVEIDEAMLESLKKADEYEKRKIVSEPKSPPLSRPRRTLTFCFRLGRTIGR